MDVFVLFVVGLAIQNQEGRREFIIVQRRRRRNAQDFLHGWMNGRYYGYYGTCSNARTGNEVCRCRRFLCCVVCSFVPTMGTRVIVVWVDGYTVGIPVLARYWRES
jgi:hypothetical protein